MRQKTMFFRFTALLLMFGAFASCNTDMEIVKSNVSKPWEQDPALWAQYTSALRAYKSSEHFISYASFNNAPKKAVSEQNFMRCLPDSLDIVSLANADNLSSYDIEDLAVMRDKGTKVLYGVDYVGRIAEFADVAKLGAYLDKVVAAVAASKLDGFSFTGVPVIDNPANAEASALIVSKLSAVEGSLLVFEGNPLFVAAADRDKIDYYALNTSKTSDVTELKLQVLNALDFAGIPAKKLLLSAELGFPLNDENRVEHAAITEVTRRVISLGPLGGLAAYNVSEDYYHSSMNYSMIRLAIQTLNPSK